MSMTQVVIGAALGCLAAQGGLYGFRQLAGWMQRDDLGARLRSLAPSPGPALVAAFVKYAGPVGMGVALVTLGVWAISDYVAARSVRSAALASIPEPALPAPAAAAPDQGAAEAAPLHTTEKADATPPAANKFNPYADPDYQVHRKAHRAGTALSLKETLLRREESKARGDLMRDVQQHLSRSQYDCEAADHARQYLKADLDVWGFASWQSKYFPVEGYKGATLAQCKDIKNIVDPGGLDLQSTVAQQAR
ncbi:MAG TPA: hypothetical protein VET66_07200 [Steroidobacteraceae bacterium]|nr:hypothetical protein [Steroidobacteraceae bacterium]